MGKKLGEGHGTLERLCYNMCISGVLAAEAVALKVLQEAEDFKQLQAESAANQTACQTVLHVREAAIAFNPISRYCQGEGSFGTVYEVDHKASECRAQQQHLCTGLTVAGVVDHMYRTTHSASSHAGTGFMMP